MTNYEEEMRKEREAVAAGFVALILLVPALIVYTLTVYLSWNWVVPAVSAMPPISFLEAFGLVIILCVLEVVIKKVLGMATKDRTAEKMFRTFGKDMLILAVIMLVCFIIHLVLAVLA